MSQGRRSCSSICSSNLERKHKAWPKGYDLRRAEHAGNIFSTKDHKRIDHWVCRCPGEQGGIATVGGKAGAGASERLLRGPDTVAVRAKCPSNETPLHAPERDFTSSSSRDSPALPIVVFLVATGVRAPTTATACLASPGHPHGGVTARMARDSHTMPCFGRCTDIADCALGDCHWRCTGSIGSTNCRARLWKTIEKDGPRASLAWVTCVRP
jgi:hypothetical protein